MNRRTFLASSIIMPFAIKEAMRTKIVTVEEIAARRANLNGVHAMLKKCGEVVDDEFDYDEIFNKLYAVRENKNAHIEMWAYGEDGAAALAAIKRHFRPAE